MGIKALFAALREYERRESAAQAVADGYPVCVECGWGSDDPELDICCDCSDAECMKQMLRGDYGEAEQREAKDAADQC